jgi:hypothetical protein
MVTRPLPAGGVVIMLIAVVAVLAIQHAGHGAAQEAAGRDQRRRAPDRDTGSDRRGVRGRTQGPLPRLSPQGHGTMNSRPSRCGE